MKCLSVSQPYADLIVQGKKTIELRTWNTTYRGEFLVHAPLKVREDACIRMGINASELRTGVIVGRAEIYGVKVYKSKKEIQTDYDKHCAENGFFDNRYGFLLKNPRELRIPIPCKGRLGFFEVKLAKTTSSNKIKTELFVEEHRYQWIGKH